jgi:hypothetical protein
MARCVLERVDKAWCACVLPMQLCFAVPQLGRGHGIDSGEACTAVLCTATPPFSPC